MTSTKQTLPTTNPAPAVEVAPTTPPVLGRYFITDKNGVEKWLPLSCGITTDYRPRLSLSSIAWRLNRMSTEALRPQILAAGIDIKLGTAWSTEVTIGDGTRRTVGYRILDTRPAALRSF